MDSYETILQRMKNNFLFKAGYTPSDVSDCGMRLQTAAAEIFDCMLYAEWLKKQMLVSTAEGESLDKHGELYGISRQAPSTADGEVWFYLSETLQSDFVIPRHTEVKNNDGYSYFTEADAVISAGDLGVTVNITATESGAAYNCGEKEVHILGKHTITHPGVIISNVLGVINAAPIAGGSDAEDDDSFRKRIADIVKFPPNGANMSYYRGLAMTVDGVRSAGFVFDDNYGTVVNMYLGTRGSSVSQATASQVQDLINSGGQIGVRVTVYPAYEIRVDLSLTIEAKPGYKYTRVEEDCFAALNEYFNNLSVGEKITVYTINDVLSKVEGYEKLNLDQNCIIPNILAHQLGVKGTLMIGSTIG